MKRNPYFKEWSKDAQPDGYPDEITQSYGLTVESQITAINTLHVLRHLSPQQLFGDTALALFNPATRTLGLLFSDQAEGALMGAPLPAWQSFLLIWPQLTALVSAAVVLFTLAETPSFRDTKKK